MTKPEAVGLSSERLARLDRVMTERYVESGELPGFQTLIWRKGELAHSNLVGMADIERGAKLREDSLYRIYSMSKPITAVALMMLVEEGKIGLDDEVHTHIPAWKKLGVYATGMPTLLANVPPQFLTTPPKRPMKVVDLVTHTSGLTYGFMMRTAVDQAYRKQKIADFQTPGGLDAMIEDLAKLPLDFSPGDYWNYSISIDVMGYLVQKLSGQSFGEFLRTRLFEPLGMKDTAFHCPHDKIGRFTSCYQPKQGGGIKIQDDAQSSTYAEPPKLESGGGGLVSSAHDYLRFCRMLLNGGTLDGVQILSPKTVEMFSLNLLPDGKLLTDMTAGPGIFSEAGYGGVGFSIGCGVNMDLSKSRLPGSQGEFFWGGAAATAFWIDPKEDLTVVFMTQVMGSDARLTLRRDLRTLVYSAFTESFA
ncbi:MAG: beta-lactamase family protein [Alphaproteobacteria bacterium]|nr:beta-lactamase family protein [Alphaproteobacteria bacterium]MBN9570841.1 beta-lactamase family protein [Alphaproteobacteria bacterium]